MCIIFIEKEIVFYSHKKLVRDIILGKGSD